ncbi:hypothetical protein WDV91_03830 [Curtobacterium flaccumfaciens pv. flaccumfaciens]|jgi:hypothetical protein|uniref:hypothetical protein n=1 Tax=Curtobacterium sp. ME-Dv--P-122a TaxID=3040286 RepID=UPI002550879A|nr:hypothetical protein [Curtobacterium sp. ME-Dv--P-122a]
MTDHELSVAGLWVNIIVGFLTLLALVIAFIEAAGARRVAENAKAEALHERRIGFELTLLRELYVQFQTTGTSHVRGFVLALIRDPNNREDLPFLRMTIGARADELSPDGEAAPRNGTSEFNRRIEREIDEAIKRRVEAGL